MVFMHILDECNKWKIEQNIEISLAPPTLTSLESKNLIHSDKFSSAKYIYFLLLRCNISLIL